MNAEASTIETIVHDLIFLLKNDPECFILKYSDETTPLDLDFVYEPGTRQLSKKKEQIPEEIREQQQPRISENVNYLCTDCHGKMYPVKNYLRPGKKPILVLHYNGSTGSKLKPDRSDKYIFGNPEEDDLFERMCRASGLETSDFYFQEFPACHFTTSNPQDPEWKKRISNCLKHAASTIKKYNIKILIFSGISAQMYLGHDHAQMHFKNMDLFDPEIPGIAVTALVLRSPAALLAMEQKRKKTSDHTKAELLEEEKKVKTLIVNALKLTAEKLATEL
ncbi:MAG: hypothetical protein OEZ34_15395 [Spirochaetia bacterium]|nr:hypothetical protein [Spirochaetia bacterium]